MEENKVLEEVVEVNTNQEIVEEEENLDEGDEDVKAPKLAKLPGIGAKSAGRLAFHVINMQKCVRYYYHDLTYNVHSYTNILFTNKFI